MTGRRVKGNILLLSIFIEKALLTLDRCINQWIIGYLPLVIKKIKSFLLFYRAMKVASTTELAGYAFFSEIIHYPINY